MKAYRPFSELRDSGLLWLINTTAIHPRGYALTLHYNDSGDCLGWSIQGDGTEEWSFVDDCKQEFDAVNALLSGNHGTCFASTNSLEEIIPGRSPSSD